MDIPTNSQPLYVAVIDITLVFVYRKPPSRFYLAFQCMASGPIYIILMYTHICEHYSSASFELRLRKDKGPENTGTRLMICPSENNLKMIVETPHFVP